MANIEITFDNPDDYQFEEGIEVVDSMIRLIDPDITEELAAYWPLFIDEDQQIMNVDIDQSFNTDLAGIPAMLFDHEPTFEEIHDQVVGTYLSDLWSSLSILGPGKWYLAVLFGGEYMASSAFPPNPQPLGYWSFDNDNAVESINGLLNGTLNGVTPINTNWGRGFYYDGGDYINLGNYTAYKISKDTTITMYIYPKSFNIRRNPFYKTYGGEGAITLETNGTLNYFYGTAGSDSVPYQGFNSVMALELNKWTMITVVRDLTNRKLYWYFNGELTASADAAYTSCATSNYNLYLGTGYTNRFYGNIDEFLLHNVALSQTEVLAIYERSSGSVIRPKGQMSIGNIKIEMRSTSFYAGNVVTEKVYTYKGNTENDVLIHINNMTEASSNYSNILFTQDRNMLSYIILNEGSGEADLIVRTTNMQDNLIVRINDSYDAAWSCNDIYGCGLDFKSSKDIVGLGNLRRLSDSWEMLKDSKFEATLPPETDQSYIQYICIMRKTSLDYEDILSFEMKVGLLSVEISINDNEEYITILDKKVRKENAPWLTNYIKFGLICTNNYTAITIDDSVVYTIDEPIERSTASVKILNNTSPAQLKSFYFGPLVVGTAVYEDLDNMEKEVIVTGTIHCNGNMFMAGIETLDSIAQLYIVADNIYLDKALYTKTPGFFFEDPTLLGIRDAVTAKEFLFYGSKTEYGIYIYEDGYWRLFEPDMRLFSIWRSRHTEGLIVQRKDETSIKIYLFGRDEETKALYYKKDIALTGLPEGEDPFKFEPSMDRRLSQKTTPWTWAKDKSLTN